MDSSEIQASTLCANGVLFGRSMGVIPEPRINPFFEGLRKVGI
jgi:hypothetical protein